jgi:ammonia channel protein AmtB
VASAVNSVWIVVAAILVMFMQAGFALVEAGFTRAKNAGNIIMKNVMDFSLGSLTYWAFGFAIAYGGSSIGGFLAYGERWVDACCGRAGHCITCGHNDSRRCCWRPRRDVHRLDHHR